MSRMLPLLKPGSRVEVIAPASRCNSARLLAIEKQLNDWQLECVINPDIFGDDLLAANCDAMRLQNLIRALKDDANEAVICARGGYGSLRLLPELYKIPVPKNLKLFMGMSDITALQLFLQQQWNWPVLHGSLDPDYLSAESLSHLQQLLFTKDTVEFNHLQPLNDAALKPQIIKEKITGGNLTLVQTSMATPWQINAEKQILFLEEINERGYKIDRMLEQLKQAGVFANLSAILIGDLTGGQEPDGTSLVQSVLDRFAAACPMPVMQIAGIGHGPCNFALPFNTNSTIEISAQEISLRCEL